VNGLHYKPGAVTAVERLRALYERRAADRIFAAFEVSDPDSPVLAEFRRIHPAGPCDYPDPSDRVAFWDRLLARQAPLEDDALPLAYLGEMDQGLYGGLLGGDVRFDCDPARGWISSMVSPLLADWSGLVSLRFSPEHPWFRRYLAQLRTFVAGAAGRFGICPFVAINGLNFAFELVGATETYTGMLDRPEELRRALDLAFEVNAAVFDAFFENVPLFHGGTFDYWCGWLPGRTIMESVDPFHQTSARHFEEWGRGPLERLFARYDGGEVHVHGNGRHLLEAVSTVAGLKAVFLEDDTGSAPAFEVLDELKARTGDVPLVVRAEFPDFVARLSRRELPGGVLYRVRGAPGVSAVTACLDEVRAYRARA
jgi:hypothetical protein